MRFLIDEMFPQAAATLLTGRGHDAVHVRELGLNGRPDAEVAAAAAEDGRVVVTENVKDFAGERDIAVLCVLKARLRGGGFPERLAVLVDGWARDNPDPYLGLHWPA